MAVSTVGLAPFMAYARESSRVEASPSPVRARVVTTEAGLTLGKFGISYTSRNVEFLPDASDSSRSSSKSSSPAAVAGFSRTESFESVLEAATIARRMVDAIPTVSSDARSGPMATRPHAAAAYAAASLTGRGAYTPRTLLATA